jgi:hypothetical protein
MEARQAGLGWIGRWVNGPGLVRLGERRQHLAVGLASVVSLLCLFLALVMLPGMGQMLFGGSATAPQIAPLRDERLVGSSREQIARYLGYRDEAEMVSAHAEGSNTIDVANADLWPASALVWLVGIARSWSCEAGDCVFVIRMDDIDYTVHYSTVAHTKPSLDGKLVRVLGSQQTQKPSLAAEFIERGSSWWVWWQPTWQVVYPGDLQDKTIWVYGLADEHPKGLFDPQKIPFLDHGSQVLVCGRWTKEERSVALDAEQIYQLEGDRYVPILDQGKPVPQPTVTLQPTPAGG